ncbi:MAG: trypsin-like peptidase domain-containing protein [Verrucomicrobiota bacterium]
MIPLHQIICLAALGAWTCAAAESPDPGLGRRLDDVYAAAAERAMASVAVVSVTEKSPAAPADLEGDTPDPLEYLPHENAPHFSQPFSYDPPARGRASAVILRKDGFLITNAHVVNNAGSVEVRLRDGRRFRAAVAGVDFPSDIAVLKVDATNLVAASWGDSSAVRVGDAAMAIGAPWSYDYSATFGRISAIGRSQVMAAGRGPDQEYLQTDASINPGNSGGPLVNLDGCVIGIVTMIRGIRTGIGFAVPINHVLPVANALADRGGFERTRLGLETRAIHEDSSDAQLFGPLTSGLVVISVVAGSPAGLEGLRPMDILLAANSRPLTRPADLESACLPGQALLLEYLRSGATNRIRLSPAAVPAAKPAIAVPGRAPLPTVDAGLKVEKLTRELADRFGVAMTEGVIVVEVRRESPAARKGIRPGDIVTAIGAAPVRSPAEYRSAMATADLAAGVPVILVRGETSRFEILKADPD